MTITASFTVDRIAELLGERRRIAARPPLHDHRPLAAASPRTRLRRPRARRDRPQQHDAAQPPARLRPRPPRRHRLPQHPPRRPGDRAQRRGELRAQPDLLRPAGDRRAGDRGRLQRRRLDARRARRGQPPLRPPHPVHRQAQPQRAADLPQPLRPGAVRERAARLGSRRGRRRRDDLLRQRGVHAPDRRDLARVRGGAPAGHVHGAVVLPAQPRLQPRRRRLPPLRRPDRPGQPPRRDDRGRHHQAEAGREQRRLQGARARATARPASSSTRS